MAGFRLTIKEALTGEVYNKPRKKRILKPNKPIMPTNNKPLGANRKVDNLGSDLILTTSKAKIPKV